MSNGSAPLSKRGATKGLRTPERPLAYPWAGPCKTASGMPRQAAVELGTSPRILSTARSLLPAHDGRRRRPQHKFHREIGRGQRTTEGASMLFIFHCRASWLAQRISCRSTSVPIFAGLWGPIRPRAGVLSTPRQCLQRGVPDWVVSARDVSLTPLTRCACSAKAVMSLGSTHVTAAQSTAREHHYTP